MLELWRIAHTGLTSSGWPLVSPSAWTRCRTGGRHHGPGTGDAERSHDGGGEQMARTKVEEKYPLIFTQGGGSKIPAGPTEVGAYNTASGTGASAPKAGNRRLKRASIRSRVPGFRSAQVRKTGP
jgi:hypothetical protein